MRAQRRFLLASLLAAAAAGCAPARSVVYTTPSSNPPIEAVATPLLSARSAAVASDRHLIVISIDGLRPDAIERFGANTIQGLMDEGRYTLHARTILPSITLPSHTSMLTGVGPEVHGITWNDNQVEARGRARVPTILETAHRAGLRTAAIASKGKLNHLLVPGTLDYFIAPAGNGSWSADRTAREVESYLAANRPNLLFVHIREPDRYGHIFGWMGIVYGWAVRQSDDAVERILASADEAFGAGEYTVIVTADHGGHGRAHGSGDTTSQTIPWIVAGQGVAPAGELPDGIRTMDTAATALWILGLPVPASYAGAPVKAAFDAESFGAEVPVAAGSTD